LARGGHGYQKGKDQKKRIALLTKLAPSRDPRIAITLWEHADNRADDTRIEAIILLADHFVKGTRFATDKGLLIGEWWEANEAELRRRAKQLPQ